MRRKIIALLVWIAVSILYCLNIADIGRSMGWYTNYAAEKQAEFRHADDLGEKAASGFAYPEDLDKKFQFDFAVISITTVIYVGVSILCYNYGFASKRKEKNEGENKQ